jgi:hypothetical protein
MDDGCDYLFSSGKLWKVTVDLDGNKQLKKESIGIPVLLFDRSNYSASNHIRSLIDEVRSLGFPSYQSIFFEIS